MFAVLGLFLNFGDKYMNRFSKPVSTYDDDVEWLQKGAVNATDLGFPGDTVTRWMLLFAQPTRLPLCKL